MRGGGGRGVSGEGVRSGRGEGGVRGRRIEEGRKEGKECQAQ